MAYARYQDPRADNPWRVTEWATQGTATTCATNDYGTQYIQCSLDIYNTNRAVTLIENINIELNVGRIHLNDENIFRTRINNNADINNSTTQMISNNFGHLSEREAKMLFVEILKQSAKEQGIKLANDIVSKRLHTGTEDAQTMKNRLLNEVTIYIPSKEGNISVSLNDILKERKEGEMLSFDFGKVRQKIIKNKKKVYAEKLKTINIIKKIDSIKIATLKDNYSFWGVKQKQDFKRLNEIEVDKELKALQLLRQLVKEDQFKDYIKNSYIDIPDFKENKIYRIHKNKRIEVINTKSNKVDKRLCMDLTDSKCPPTDAVIAKYLITINDKKKLLENSNHFNGDNGLTTPFGINRDELLAEVRATIPQNRVINWHPMPVAV